MAGLAFTQSTKLLLKNIEKANCEEVAGMISKEFDSQNLAGNFILANIDGMYFMQLSDDEKLQFFPGMQNMMNRRRLTEMIQYAQLNNMEEGAGDLQNLPSLPSITMPNIRTPPRRNLSATEARIAGTPSSRMMASPTMVVAEPRDLLADANLGATLAATAVAAGLIAPGQPLPLQQPTVPAVPIHTQRTSNIDQFTTEAIDFRLYTDLEIESHRHLIPMPKNDRNRLTRQTISSMRVRCSRLLLPREPERSEMLQMAQALCMRYPGLRDANMPDKNWELCARYLQDNYFRQLLRRQQNVTPVKRPQGMVPQRSRSRVASTEVEEDDDMSDTRSTSPPEPAEREPPSGSAPVSKPNVSKRSSSAALLDDDDDSSLMSGFQPLMGEDEESMECIDKEEMASHHAKLTEIWAKKNPSMKKVKFFLLAEKVSRRAYIDNCGVPIPDKVIHVLERYPMFRDSELSINEMGLILAFTDDRLDEIKADLAQNIESIYSYGIRNKKITSAEGGKAKQKFTSVMKNLAAIFPSKKKPRNKDAIFVECKEGEDYMKHAKSCILPRMILAGKEVIIAVAGIDLNATSTPKNMMGWGNIMVAFMSLFYTFTLPYPQGFEIALLLVQNTSMQDDMHPDDRTPEFNKALKKYNEFCRDE